MRRFDREEWHSSLTKISQPRQFAFAAACVERMFGCYNLISTRADLNSLGREVVGNIVQLAWDVALGKILNNRDLDRLITAVQNSYPNEDTLEAEEGIAIDALSVAASSMEFLKNRNLSDCVECAYRTYAAFDHFAVSKFPNQHGNFPEEKILASNHVQDELYRQKRDLLHLTYAKEIDNAIIALRLISKIEARFFGHS